MRCNLFIMLFFVQFVLVCSQVKAQNDTISCDTTSIPEEEMLKYYDLIFGDSVSDDIYVKTLEYIRDFEAKIETVDSGIMIYKNDELEIGFPGSYVISNEKTYFESNYFSNYIERVRFYWHTRRYTCQSIMYTGYLCSMYILPLEDEKSLLKEIEKAFEPKGALASYSGVEKIIIEKYEVLKWRAQNGKTRLDHYLLKSEKKYYLFISSPYGSNGYIEDIISKIKIKQ